ncbi:MAG: isochorismatase family protein [Solirubrobacterales bacterium]|jgi:ureidoacrylate peracid hydrolase|nr:isochorismatase family protein [Solirubrobacterales bacterium]
MTADADHERAALVVIDMQNDYCHEDGACGKTFPFWTTEHTARMIPVLQETIAAAREAAVPVVWVRSSYSPWVMSRRWERRGAGEPLHICRPGTWGSDLHEGFEPQDGEAIIVKPRYSAFVGTQFELGLRVQGIETLYITGVTTNVCIETTARDAFMRDFDAVVVGDCAATYAPAVHEASLWNVRTHFGRVMTAAEVRSRWGKSVPA